MTKRAVDIVLGTVLAVVFTPVIVVLALGTAWALRCWPFFVHRRVGRHGRQFLMVKIRTMPPSTPLYATRDAVAQLQIPRFCAALRKLHVDELPQLYYVPLGWMSLVGPRPEMPAFHQQMDPELAALRTSVRPGCSGLWQVTDGIDQVHYVVPVYDRFYLANANWRLDLWILGQTLTMVLPGRQAPTLAEVPRWALPRRGLADVIDIRVPNPPDLATGSLAADG